MIGVSDKHVFVCEENRDLRRLIYEPHGQEDLAVYARCSERSVDSTP